MLLFAFYFIVWVSNILIIDCPNKIFNDKPDVWDDVKWYGIETRDKKVSFILDRGLGETGP